MTESVKQSAAHHAGPSIGLIILGTGTLLFVAAFGSTFADVIAEWTGNGPYSHGLLALAIIIWMFWQQQDLLVPTQKPQSFWLPVIAAGGVSWWIASLVNVWFIEIAAILGMYYASFSYIFGFAIAWKMRITLLSLALVLPIWNILQLPLQQISTEVTHWALNLLSIPVFREGFRFSVPGGQFVVEEACSGLGFFLTSILLALLFSYYNQLRGIRQLYFLFFAVALSLVSNWIRIIIIIVVGNATSMDHFIVQDHLTFGWIVFSMALIPFFVVGHRLVNGEENNTLKHSISSKQQGSVRHQVMLALTIVFFPFFSWVHATLLVANSGSDQVIHALNSAASLEPTTTPKTWNPQFYGASEIQQQTFRTSTGLLFSTLVIRYDHQEQGQELINVNNRLFDDKQWILNQESRLRAKSGADARMISLKNHADTKRTILYWYTVGGQQTGSPVKAKVAELFGAIQGSETAHLIAVAVDTNRHANDDAILQLTDTVAAIQEAYRKGLP